MNGRLDAGAVAVGAAIVAAVYLPLLLVYALAIDDDGGSNVVFLLAPLVLVMCGVGGYVAGSRSADTPMTHGAVAALVGVGLGQVVSVVLDLARDDPVHPVSIVFNLIVAANVGLLGGLLADRRRTQRA